MIAQRKYAFTLCVPPWKKGKSFSCVENENEIQKNGKSVDNNNKQRKMSTVAYKRRENQ